MEFAVAEKQHQGIACDLSQKGFFIRTNLAYVPGTEFSVTFSQTGESPVLVRVVVRRAIRTPIPSIKNGMGVLILEKDPSYLRLIQSLSGEGDGGDAGPKSGLHAAAEKGRTEASSVVVCPACGARNRLQTPVSSRQVRCGKCCQSLKGTA